MFDESLVQFYDVFLRQHENNGALEGRKHRHTPSSWPSMGSDLDAPLHDTPPTDSVDGSSDREGEEEEEKHLEVNVRDS